MKLLFVGESRSPTAKRMGVTWKDGRLAAKPLFEALEFIGIDPAQHKFVNWFEGGKQAVRSFRDGSIVAMGKKVQRALDAEGIQYIGIVHPAARGKIRKRETYISHVYAALSELKL
jgi:hypothetical protein